ncbi:hypothetical protein BTA51_28115 [Hahella sp. CCB-MM4]|nr:hypothetical protein BTA51_28115 [Hahella sp. CCB-MM4]
MVRILIAIILSFNTAIACGLKPANENGIRNPLKDFEGIPSKTYAENLTEISQLIPNESIIYVLAYDHDCIHVVTGFMGKTIQSTSTYYFNKSDGKWNKTLVRK